MDALPLCPGCGSERGASERLCPNCGGAFGGSVIGYRKHSGWLTIVLLFLVLY